MAALEDATYKSTKPFAFETTVRAKVVKVYDGDTCTCVFDTFGLGLFRHQIRLSGVDTPELKSKNPDEKAAAILVRDFVAGLILGKIVDLKCEGSDKYGRILGTITVQAMPEAPAICINTLLVEKKMARSYDGGTKQEFAKAEA